MFVKFTCVFNDYHNITSNNSFNRCQFSMSSCGKCKAPVSRTIKTKVQCKQCRSFFHGRCVNLTLTEIEVISASGLWSCEVCTLSRRLSRSLSDSTPVSSPSQGRPATTPTNMAITNEVLKTLLNEMKKEIIDSQTNIEKELGKALDHCMERINEFNELIRTQQDLISKQQQMINGLEVENRRLRGQLKDVVRRQGDLEQYSRRNTLEIFGVPEAAGETNSSLKKTVIQVGEALGVKLSEDGIDACHRINGGNNRPTTGIIVKFLRRDDPDQLLAKRKVKRDFSTRHLQGHATDSVIYINPSLTPVRRVLLAKARKLRSDYNYRFVWADRVGRIKVRKSDDKNSRIIVLNDEEDLASLVQKESGQG